MKNTGWRGWMNSLAQTLSGKRDQLETVRNVRRTWPKRLELERLEDRIALATNITIIVGVAGAGSLDHFLSANNGTITTAADPGDTAATLSLGALQSVGSSTPITIAADATIHFNDITSLSLLTGTGVNAAFSTTTGAIDFANVANTVSTGGGSLTFSAGADLSVANLNTSNGAITLAGAGLQVNSAVNSGTARTILTASTPGEAIDLGGNTAGTVGLTDAELANITAGVLQIGGSSFAGAITIDGVINTHAGYNTLDLIATGSGGAILQSTGSITVANLVLQADAGIGSAGAIQVVGPIDVAFSNTTSNNVQISSTGALTIAAVDGVTTSANSASGGTVTLTAASPITIAISTSSSGTYSMTSTETASEGNPGGQLPPPDDDITVNANVTVESTGGDVDLTSGDSVTIQSGATVKSDTGTVDFESGVGDTDDDASITIYGAINAANVTLDSPGDIGVSGITATGTVMITSTGGHIADIGDVNETEPTNLVDDLTNGASADVTANGLGMFAATGIGVNGGTLETQVSYLEADATTYGVHVTNGVAGPITLHVGGVSGLLDGVRDNGGFGSVQLINNGSIDVVTPGDVIRTEGTATESSISVDAVGANADIQTGGQSTLDAIGAAGTGTVSVLAGRDILMGNASGSGSITAAGADTTFDGSLGVQAGRDLIIDFDSRISLDGGTHEAMTSAGRNLTLQATGGATGARITNLGSGVVAALAGVGGVFTLNSGANGEILSNGGSIVIAGDDMVINDPITTQSTTTGRVILTQAIATGSTAHNISLGGGNAANSLGLSDSELGWITAGVLQIGEVNPGNIVLDGAVTSHPGFSTLDLESGGAIVEGSGGSITVANLALRAGQGAAGGIGSTGAIAVVGPTTVAFHNNNGGNVQISSTGTLTIGSVDGLDNSMYSQQVANLDTFGTVTLTAASPITIAISTSSGGTYSMTTTETASEGNPGDQLPPPDDDVTVNSGVTVESTSGDVDLTSGDGITTQANSVLKSDNGTVNLSIGVGDDDNDAALSLDGTISGNVGVTETGTIYLDDLPSTITRQLGKTISITSTAGAILDSSDPMDAGDDTDVTAGALALSASTGIGTATDNIVTAVSTLAANTETGGVYLTNTGALSVGDVNGVAGVLDNGASGDIVLTNAGTVSLLTSGASVYSVNGSATVTATGATSNVVIDAGPTATGIGGGVNVTVQAGQDILVGSAAGIDAIDAGSGLATVKAGRDVILDDGAEVGIASGLAGGATVTALRNITLQDTTTPGALIATSGGSITLTTGAGGAFTLNSGSGGEVTSTVNSGKGAVTINADAIVLDDPVNAGTGIVTLEQAGTTPRNIDLGGGATAGDLGLTDAELGQVAAGALRIGRTDNTASLTVTDNSGGTSGITTHAGFSTLDLLSGGAVTAADSNATITVANLAVQSAGSVDLSLSDAVLNSVGTLAAGVTGSGSSFSFNNNGDLTVGTVDGVSGITTFNGALGVSTFNGNITVANNVSVGNAGVNLTAGTANSGHTIVNQAAISETDPTQTIILRADDFDLQPGGSITAAGTVNPRANSAGVGVDLGSTASGGGVVSLSQAELNTITAVRVVITSFVDINFSQSITLAAAKIPTLLLEAGFGAVTDIGSTAPDVTVANLATTTANGVSLTTAVGNLAFTNTGGAVSFNNTGALTIDSVGGVATSSNTGTTTTLSAAGAIIYAVNTTSAGTIKARTTEGDEDGPNDDNIIVNNGVTVESTGGDVDFTAADGDHIAGTVTSDTGAVNPVIGVGDNDDDATLIVTGQIKPTPTLTSINPTSATVGDPATPVTANGTNFINGYTVNFNGMALATTFVSAAQLTAVIPAADLTTGGMDFITVSAPGGSDTTAAQTFTVNNPAPTLTSISPASASAGDPDTTITLRGNNFINSSTADFNGAPVTTTFVSATQLTAVIPAADLAAAGNDMITVVTAGPGGGASDAQKFTVNNVTAGAVTLSLAPGDALQVQQAPDGVVGDIVATITHSDGTTTQKTLTGVTSLTINSSGNNPAVIQFPASGTPLVSGPIQFVGGATANTLTLAASGLKVKVAPGFFSVGDPQIVTYSDVSAIQIDGAAAINSFAGPDTADRPNVFTGLTAQERFVQALYLDELGRAGTVAELDGWVAVLNGPDGSPAVVAADIADSMEAQDNLVKSWYLSYLGRAAVNGEELGWVNLLRQGQSGEQVLSEVLAGPEFYGHAQTLVSSGTGQDRYVQSLYQLLLGRTGSSDEVAGWVNQLNAQSLTPQVVALAFQQSVEFRTDLTEAYYNALLHRPDDPMGLNGWVFSNLDAASIRLGFEASPEFFTNG